MKLKTFISTTTLTLTLMIVPAVNAKSCKELSKTTCKESNSCSWTNGYTTKKGVKVKSYCRNKPGRKASKKSTSKKSKDTTKKTKK